MVLVIQAYGLVLKGLLSIALAAFPEARARAMARIDQAVNKATELVNAAADTLKKGVAAVLDVLSSTLDSLLGLLQDLYSGILTVVGMLISGELQELLGKVGHLVDAAKTVPDTFEIAAYEELLGGNLDQPLSPAELKAAGRTSASRVKQANMPGSGLEAETELGAQLPGPPWTENNIGVDAVATGETLSPELTAQLIQMTGGDGEVIFGESGDESRSLESILGLGAQTAQTSAPGHQAETAAGETAYDDGLTPRERAEVKWDAMKNGISSWLAQNWPAVLAGGVLGVAGFIVANILTGGAILAALPVVMTAVGYVFSGLMIAQLAGHLRDYLQKSWNGDIEGGGKSLAKGLAAGAIELITLLTFKVGSAALKGARAAGRGAVKGAQAVARGTAKVAKGAMSVARRGASYVLKGGKVLLRGAGQGIGRGVKRLGDLGKRLLQRTRFKGSRVRIRGRRFTIEGKINPWVLLSTGKLVEVDDIRGKKVGDDFKVDGTDGIIIGSHTKPSRYVKSIESGTQEAAEVFDELSALTPDQRTTRIYGRKSTYQLRKGIPGPHPRGYQAHHILPEELMGNNTLKKFLEDLGFDFQDGTRNGILLPPDEAARLPGWKKASVHLGSHPNYTQRMEKHITSLHTQFNNQLKNKVSLSTATERATKGLENILHQTRKNLMDGTELLN
ncbi:AHH domain-containing protein [Haliangium ochraceum]|uniref:AHH domain-containing protein n=1 Tax=Haliangium ochraceum TaxID=80816 RepID=UPI00019BABC7|nr:AHH domain-containing protein [Haliangium ochraceum]